MDNNKIVLKIEGTECKIEKPEELATSYYQKEYIQAWQVVREIIRRSLQQAGQDYTQVQNIVPFIGKRGTGKTSSMLSFMEALKGGDYNKLDKGNETVELFSSGYRDVSMAFQMSDQREQFLFTCLEVIDASLLEQGEDIFKVILAQMYNKFLQMDQHGSEREDKMESSCRKEDKETYSKEMNYTYFKRLLQQQFDKVYRSISQLEREGWEHGGEDAPITSLKNLSISLKIKKDFWTLVKEYLRIICSEKKLNSYLTVYHSFLVIAIDDLDLNIHSGYDMIEKIHRYMMIPNVIILLTLDYDQMKILCERHFVKIISTDDGRCFLKNRYGAVERLAQDFLDKVIPFNMRIYMPVLSKISNVEVVMIEESSDRKTLNSKTETLKKAIFSYLYQKLGMRMDVVGTKHHFFEQNSLRTYVSFYLMLKSMEYLTLNNDSPDDQNHFWKVYQQNYRILIADICNRMVNECLTIKYKEVFLQITDMTLPKSCRKLFSYMPKITDLVNSKTDKENIRSLVKSIQSYGYSYGELLRIIYYWGRVNEQSKEMIRCLLAYYSVEMTCLFWQYRLNVNKDKAYQNFLEILNGSFIGSWANKMIPLVKFREISLYIGIYPNVDMAIVFDIGLDIFKSPRTKNGLIDLNQLGSQINNEFLSELKQIFKSVIVIAMFFAQPYYKSQNLFEWKIERKAQATKSNREKLQRAEEDYAKVGMGNTANKIADITVKLSNQRECIGVFNIMNFLPNAFQYQDTVNKIVENLYDVFFEGNNKEERKEDILKQLGMREEFEAWENKSNGFALPIYDMDLCYNIMKRLRQRMYGHSRELHMNNKVWADEFIEEIRQQYQFIENKLAENDEYYSDIQARELSKFRDIFSECPYIKWFKNENKNELVGNFSELFCKVIMNMVGLQKSQDSEARDKKEEHGFEPEE